MATINTAMRYLSGQTGEPGNLKDLTVEFLRGDNAAFLARVATDLKALAKKAGPAGRGSRRTEWPRSGSSASTA